MTLKVLALDRWMTTEWTLQDCLESGRYPPVTPQFHRPGIYLQGKDCWFELADGRAYAYTTATVSYELRIMHAERLNQRQIDALIAMRRERLATKQQLRLLRDWEDAMLCRATYRNTRKHMLKLRP